MASLTFISFLYQMFCYFYPVKFVSQISSILVALLFIYTINFKSIITIHYFINTSEITELFCINKEKPQLQCNGKCHLAKQLIKANQEETETPFPNQQLSYNLDITSVLTSHIFYIAKPEPANKKYATYYGLNTIDQWYSIPSPPPKG